MEEIARPVRWAISSRVPATLVVCRSCRCCRRRPRSCSPSGWATTSQGVTFECDFPPEARAKRVVSSSGLEASTEAPRPSTPPCGRRPRAARRCTGWTRRPSPSIDPDVILTQDLCRVCAVPSGDVDEALGRLGLLGGGGVPRPAHAGRGHRRHRPGRDGPRRRGPGAERDAALRRRAAGGSTDGRAGHAPPTVLVLEWVDPPFGAGHWIPDMVRAAGGHAGAGAPREPTRAPLDVGRHRPSADPDASIVAPCGFGLDGAVEQAQSVRAPVPRADHRSGRSTATPTSCGPGPAWWMGWSCSRPSSTGVAAPAEAAAGS